MLGNQREAWSSPLSLLRVALESEHSEEAQASIGNSLRLHDKGHSPGKATSDKIRAKLNKIIHGDEQ